MLAPSRLFPGLIVSLWVVRVLLVCQPQTGYIHPDEFFQSVEVAANDILNVEGKRTWEFNANFPIRSVVPVHVTAGFPLYLLKSLDQWLDDISPVSLVTSSTVLIAPRLFLTLLSFFGDFCIWNLSRKFGVCPKTSLLLYASSYVTIVFYTRTFSNTTESLLFSVLLLFATSDICDSEKRDKSIKNAFSKEENVNEMFGNIWFNTIVCSIVLGLLLALGVFSRPTFVIFAFVPIVLWIQKSYSWITVVGRLAYLTVGFVLMLALIVSLDTVYYRKDLVDFHLDVSHCLELSDGFVTCIYEAAKDHFVFTPWNFILYNTNKDNLASHGAHPWHLHLTANSTMLFGPLGIIAVFMLLKAIRTDIRHCLDWRQNKLWPLLWMFYLPILLLSAFPHQETRFIIPLLTPVVLLTAHVFKSRSSLASLLAGIWILFNVSGVTLFGFFHQGGVVPSLTYLGSKAPTGTTQIGGQKVTPPAPAVHHIIYFHTYMPPEHLLLRDTNITVIKRNTEKSDISVKLHDLKGAEDNQLRELISTLKRQSTETEDHKVFVVAPFTRVFNNCHKFGLKWVRSFSPHLSMEDPPDVFKMITHSGWTDSAVCLPTGDPFAMFYRLRNMFSLILLQAH